jgi:hypothetical protein
MFIALATAMAQLACDDGTGEHERIVLSKPVIPMGADIGSLPGDFEAKMQPWMMSLFDNLDQLMPDAEDAVVAKGATQAEKAREHLFQTGQLKVQAAHDPRPICLARRYGDRRGAEPHAPRDRDRDHVRRERHQGGALRRPVPSRQPLPRRCIERTRVCNGAAEELADDRGRMLHQGGAKPSGRARRIDALTRP